MPDKTSPWRGLTLIAAIVASTLTTHAAPLDATLRAHGGLPTWQTFGTLEYDLAINFGDKSQADHQRFDLSNRHGLITNPDYALGYDGNDVWVDAADGKGPVFPPRFYLWTPFYFFGIPFVLADPGVIQTQLPAATFEGREYDVVKITYAAGIGDAPDDYYIVYVDRDTREVRLARYIVTYFAKQKGEPTTGLPESAIVYDTWQTVNGLKLPHRTSLYHWSAETNSLGARKGEMTFANVRLYAPRPPAETFAPPSTTTTR